MSSEKDNNFCAASDAASDFRNMFHNIVANINKMVTELGTHRSQSCLVPSRPEYSISVSAVAKAANIVSAAVIRCRIISASADIVNSPSKGPMNCFG